MKQICQYTYFILLSLHHIPFFFFEHPLELPHVLNFMKLVLPYFWVDFFFFLLSIYKSIYYNTVYIFKLAEGYTRYNIIYIFFFPVRPSWRCIHIVLYNDKLFILAESTAIYFSVY